MDLEWHKCKGNIWCDLNKIDENHPYLSGFSGIFVVWSGRMETDRSVLIVGYGDIKKEIIKYRNDLAIKAFNHLGVFITWADVPFLKRKSIINQLIFELKPKMNEKVDKAPNLKLNLPWATISPGS